HGDELTGIELVKQMLAVFGLSQDPSGVHEAPLIYGNLFMGFGNPAAIDLNARGASENSDLNRSFSSLDIGRKVRPDDPVDVIRARELVPLFERTDYLFDIHATSNDSYPFVCFGEYDARFQSILDLIPVERVITDPLLIYTKDQGLPELGTTDYYVNRFGGSEWSKRRFGKKQGLGICYETGQQEDVRRVPLAMFVVIRLMRHVGSIKEKMEQNLYNRLEIERIERQAKQRIYAITHRVDARSSDFKYAEGMKDGWLAVGKGCLVGEYGDGERVYTPASGSIVFQRKEGKIDQGRCMFCIVQEIAL
ncbi:MAG: hypothetical protein CO042_04645, partial [Parcubacteria group bacterium CG_4_9_14_0_2_um_filter_41_8]